ncbi:MAG: Arm DNA-binding domain-containing protein [Sphingomonas bacterium]|nr:Arm DNA-binding domain-containing protein [Sphingomonas bacterium]
MNNELTDRKIAAIKQSGRREELKDGRWPLWLIVQPTGTKSFQWRGTVGGRDRRKTLGRYYDRLTGSGIRLAEARTLSLSARLDAVAQQDTIEVPAPPPSPLMRECFKLYMQREGGRLV